MGGLLHCMIKTEFIIIIMASLGLSHLSSDLNSIHPCIPANHLLPPPYPSPSLPPSPSSSTTIPTNYQPPCTRRESTNSLNACSTFQACFKYNEQFVDSQKHQLYSLIDINLELISSLFFFRDQLRGQRIKHLSKQFSNDWAFLMPTHNPWATHVSL